MKPVVKIKQDDITQRIASHIQNNNTTHGTRQICHLSN